MRRPMRDVVFASLLLTLVACAHPVTIAPQLDFQADRGQLVDKRVGYRITDVQRALEVTTPGGGGDDIAYYPYRDLESGLYETLASVFSVVHVVPDAGAEAFIVDKGLNFVFTPSFETDSSSSNILFWNPTDFTLKLRASAVDAAGKEVWTREFVGHGKASAGGSPVETPAAQAAAVDVYQQLRQALLEAPVFAQ